MNWVVLLVVGGVIGSLAGLVISPDNPMGLHRRIAVGLLRR